MPDLSDFPDLHSAVTSYVYARDYAKALKEANTKMNQTMVQLVIRGGDGNAFLFDNRAVRASRRTFTPPPRPSAPLLRQRDPKLLAQLSSPTFKVLISGLMVPHPDVTWPTTGHEAVLTALTTNRQIKAQQEKDRITARDQILSWSPGSTAKANFGVVTVDIRHGNPKVDWDQLKAQDPDLYAAILKPQALQDYYVAREVSLDKLNEEEEYLDKD